MEEVRRDTRNTSSLWGTVTSITALGMALFHIYTGAFGVQEALMQRVVHLLFALTLVFLTYPAKKGKSIWKPGNVILVTLSAVSVGYLLLNFDYVTSVRLVAITPMSIAEKVLGFILILLLLEAGRRVIGWILPAIALVALAYTFLGPYLPGIFHHGGYDLQRVLELNFLTTNAIFGVPLGVSSTYIVLFIIFGAFLNASGLGQFFLDFAKIIAGRSPGGPAKVAVFSSGLMGSVSGSAVANVVTTGSFTIPTMKRLGYQPHFAGAVEAVASTGGILMPPVMGSVAFIMSEFTGIAYIEIVKYALVPAILYYFSIYLMVHFEALRLGLRGLSKDEIPNVKDSIAKNWHLTIPLVVLVVLLIKRYSPMISVIYSIFSLIIVAYLRPHTRMGIKEIMSALESGAKGSLLVVMACALSGIIIGSVSLTGLGIRFTSSIVDLAGGNLILILILTAIAAIILGMGLPSVVSYMLLLALVIPALTSLGVPLVAAHFFAIYFSTTAFFTPPYAVAAFAAAGIAGSDVMRTGFTAMRLGMASYIIPFMFVFGPPLLLLGSFTDTLLAIPTALLGIVALAVAGIGFMKAKMGILERIIAFVAALLLIKPGLATDLVGILGLGLVVLLQLYKIGGKFSLSKRERAKNVYHQCQSKEEDPSLQG